MKYTIEGFNQEEMIKLNMDYVDSLLLRYFIDFKDTGKMIAEIFDNKPYYWIKYESVIEQLPILKLKSKDSVYRRYKKLVKTGILLHKTRKDKRGIYSFYSTGPNYEKLISSTPYGFKSDTLTDEKSEQKINLLKKDSSIKSFLHVNQLHEHLDDSVIEYFNLYMDYYNCYMQKQHVRISEENIKLINYDLKQIVDSVSEDINLFRNAVIEHFNNLPANNNGSIISFLTASFRYFEVESSFTKRKKVIK